MTKLIRLVFEVPDDVDEDKFLEAVTVQVHEIRAATDSMGSDQTAYNAILDQVINVGEIGSQVDTLPPGSVV